MKINKDLINIIDYLESHNKNYTQKQYLYINYLKDIFKNDYLKQLKKEYIKKRIFNKIEIETISIFTDLKFDHETQSKKLKKFETESKKLFYEYTKNNNYDFDKCGVLCFNNDINGYYFYKLNFIIACIDYKPVLIHGFNNNMLL